jgi:hypothetical protein
VEHHVYSRSDSLRYHVNGLRIAEEYLNGQRSLTSLVPTSTGTRFIDEVNGIVSLASGRTILASFMVFSWLAYIGSLGFIWAARRSIPTMPIRGYAATVIFAPSMLFWTGGLGKDAWIIFAMGVFATGASLLITGSFGGIVPALFGGYLVAVVRPHVALLLILALAVSPIGKARAGQRPAYLAIIIFVSLLAGIASGFAREILPNFDDGFGSVLERTQERSTAGGSAIEVTAPNSPIDYPFALTTVLFRPFLLEVSNPAQLLSALEGTALMVWAFSRRSTIASSLRRSSSVPWIRLSLLYVLAFGFAWSSVGNLGIIVRQRVQVIPFLLILFFAGRDGTRKADGTDECNCATSKGSPADLFTVDLEPTKE